jgi:hypothetical protein
MKGDFSRILFDPAKHYDAVLNQQGRVWLDSDWNEDVLERLEASQAEMRDIVGGAGVPAPGSGFVISASANPNAADDFQISAGRCYVDGILCRLEKAASYHTQPDFLDAPAISMPTSGTVTALVYLEVWRRLITYLEDSSIREIALGGPDTSVRLKTVAQIKTVLWPNAPQNPTCAQGSALIPTLGQGTLTTLQPQPQPQTPCQLPDPANYTGRENLLYRVQIHDGGDPGGSGASFQIALSADATAGSATLTLVTALTAAQASAALRGGFVTVADNSGASERVPIVVAAAATIQLAQALQQTHTKANAATVTGGVAQFKWSRNNASFAISITNVASDRVSLTLASLGRDVVTSLRQGDLVEICDDASELGPSRGHLTYVTSIPDPDTLNVTLQEPIPAAFVLSGGQSSRNLLLRRWDGVDAANAEAGFNSLGDGVQIQFGGSFLQPGDYWQFTTRSADGSVQPLLNAAPAGIRRSRAPLGIVTWGPPPPTSPPSSPPAGMAMTVVDCRNVFPILSGAPQPDKVVHVTGVTLVAPNSGPASALVNDTNIQITSFGGIDVQCDAALDPASISRPTCFLTIEYPIDFSGQGAVTAYLQTKLAGTVSANGGVISWRPIAQTQAMLQQLIIAYLSERGILTRLVLKGNFIWSASDPSVFLDGEVFGAHQSGMNNQTLILPSGDKRRGGDFETWFWLVAAPSFVSGITPQSAQIYAGGQQVFTVTFSSPAPAASNMALTATPANIVNVPATVAVAAGASSATFTATTAVAAAPVTGTVSINVSFGGQSMNAVLTVAPLPVLTGQVALAAASIPVAGTTQGTVTLNGPAPSSGIQVQLTSSSPAIATVPAAATIPAGQTTVSFTITGVAAGTSTITATAQSGGSVSALITVFLRKVKDTKEIKDTKETKEVKDGKDTKEVDRKLTDKVAEKVLNQKSFEAAKIADNATPLGLAPLGDAAAQPEPMLHAFIRPGERPAVEKTVLDANRVQ